MSKNIIYSYLLDGELEQKLSRATEEENRLIGIVADLDEELCKLLNEEQKSLLKKFQETLDDHNFEECMNYFAEGFKAGILMGLEINRSEINK